MSDVVAGEDFSFPIVFRTGSSDASTFYWGDPKHNRVIPGFLLQGQGPLLGEILVLGPEKMEQRKRFGFWHISEFQQAFTFIPNDKMQALEVWVGK
jgi:hypothetical protein